MKKLTIFLTLVLTAASLSAQCDFRQIYSGSYRLTALDVAVSGNDLWVPTSYGIALYDRSVTPPRPVASLALPGTTTQVAATGSYAYVTSGTSLHVIKREQQLRLVKTVVLGGTASDILLTDNYLYIAGSAGVTQVDLILPENPAVTRKLLTSAGSALSVARLQDFLYAADGDSSIEVYSIQAPSFPQQVGTFASLSRSTAVHSSGSRLFVSDGNQTEIFTGSGAAVTRIATLNTGATIFQLLTSDIVFMAGTDRRLRALDLTSVTQPISLYQTDFPTTFGSVNRFTGLAIGQGQLYAAAGDSGLLTYDISEFATPYPVRSYQTNPSRSVFTAPGVVFVALSTGGLRRYSQSSSGDLTPVTDWDTGRISTIHDGNASGTEILTSNDSELRLWNVSVTPPQVIASVTMARPVGSAVLLAGRTGYAVLTDRSIFRFDFGSAPAAVAQVTISGASPSSISRGIAAVAVADINNAGTTTIRYFANGDLTSTPQVATIEGAATSGIAVANQVVAAATFKGLTLASFASGGSVAVIPDTNSFITRDLQLDGDRLFALNSEDQQTWRIQSWDTKTFARTLSLELPDAGVNFHKTPGASTLSVATEAGVATVQTSASTAQPEVVPTSFTNTFYRKIVAGDRRLYLFDGRNIDVMTVSSDGFPSPAARLVTGGPLIDVAAARDLLFTLSGTGRITAYAPTGAAVATYQINEGIDQVPKALNVVAGALYASVERGCLSGNCEKKTLVLDTRNGLTLKTTLTGELLDAVVSGTRAYTLFSIPNEIRILNVADPHAPATIASATSEGNPVSIGYSAQRTTVYTLGTKAYAYSEASLSKIGELLDPFVADTTGRISYTDQIVRLEEGCSLVIGRRFSPNVFSVITSDAWAPVNSAPESPAAVRSLAEANGLYYLLSDYSLDIWTRAPLDLRRRPARR